VRGRDYHNGAMPARMPSPRVPAIAATMGVFHRPSPMPSPDDNAPDYDDPGYERPSKTRLKKESHDMQHLGEQLAALSDGQLAGLGLAEFLFDAVQMYKRTKSHEGRRRQMQYVGKLMRRVDVEPIREAVASLQLGHAKDSLALHQAERWRVEMLASDDALTPWMAEHPGCDVQQLRSLIRAARKDAAAAPEQRSGRAFRELFQFIKSQLAADHDPADATDE
jgi:ribosome-associated protein